MGEISAASNEQASGVAQVGEAVRQMDNATQQNAALVEEMAAAASSLKVQAQDLVQVVAVFKLAGGDHLGGAHKTAVRSSIPKSTPFKGAERRDEPAAAKPRAAAPKPTSPAAKPLPALKSPPKTAAKATPAGGDDDWETF
jgi:hypothetical protein